MIPLTRKTLAMITFAILVIIVAVTSTWWYQASPTTRTLAFSKFQSIVIYGAISGGIYALLALGFTLVYGVAEIVNMAYAALFMVGAYIFWALTTPQTGGLFEPIQLDLSLAFVIAVILTAIIGATLYRVTMQPIIEDIISVIVVTVGALVIFQEIIVIQFTGETRGVTTLIGGTTRIGDVQVHNSALLAFAASLALFAGLWIFISKAKMGKAMRAVAQDREVAMLMGINTQRLFMVTMAISASLAAIAGILWSFSTSGGSIRPYMWETPLFMAFATVILGGLGSIKGTILGAFIIGYAGNTFVLLIPEKTFLRGVIALATMVMVLLLRPKGLFGRRIEME